MQFIFACEVFTCKVINETQTPEGVDLIAFAGNVQIMHAIICVKPQEHILFLSKLYPWCDYRAFGSTAFSFVSFVWSLFT